MAKSYNRNSRNTRRNNFVPDSNTVRFAFDKDAPVGEQVLYDVDPAEFTRNGGFVFKGLLNYTWLFITQSIKVKKFRLKNGALATQKYRGFWINAIPVDGWDDDGRAILDNDAKRFEAITRDPSETDFSDVCALITEFSLDPNNWKNPEKDSEREAERTVKADAKASKNKTLPKAKPSNSPKAKSPKASAPSKPVKKPAVLTPRERKEVNGLLERLAELGFKPSANKS